MSDLATKWCAGCEAEKPRTGFARRPERGPDAIRSRCTDCERTAGEVNRRRYKRSEKGRATERRYAARASTQRLRREFTERRVRALREFVRWLKEAPCADCRRSYPPECMDFDHVRGRKRMQVSLMAGRAFSWRVLQEELQKCELVCANCHRTRTVRRMHVAHNEEVAR